MNISKNISNREDIEYILIKYILKEKKFSNKDPFGFDYDHEKFLPDKYIDDYKSSYSFDELVEIVKH